MGGWIDLGKSFATIVVCTKPLDGVASFARMIKRWESVPGRRFCSIVSVQCSYALVCFCLLRTNWKLVKSKSDERIVAVSKRI